MMKTKRYRLLHVFVGRFLSIVLLGRALPSSYSMVAKAQPVPDQMAANGPDQVTKAAVTPDEGKIID